MAFIEHPDPSLTYEQLKRYAVDLSRACKQEKDKRIKLQSTTAQLQVYAGALNTTISQLKEASDELKDAQLEVIQRLSLAAEFKDEDTGSHIVRTSRYCAFLAEKLGLPREEVDLIFAAAPMHDIGKVGIPDSILMKPAKLSADEFEIIKSHTTLGAKILSNSKARVIQVAQQIAISHHEKWNGTGYPLGLAGASIPIAGRIVGIIDVFDALTSERPYKKAYPFNVSVEIIKEERGKHFDPEVVDIFIKHIDEIHLIKMEIDAFEDPSLEKFTWSERDAFPPEST